jgi:hypothetical protein
MTPAKITAVKPTITDTLAPEWRFEPRDEAADLGVVRRQQVGEDRDQTDHDEDRRRDHREIAEPDRDRPPADARRQEDGIGLYAHAR